MRILPLVFLGFFICPFLAEAPSAWKWEERSPIPAPSGVRFLYQTPPTVEGRIYVVYYRWVFQYDPSADTWVTYDKPMPTFRNHYATVALGGKLYAIGGAAPGDVRFSAIEEFDPATQTWRACASMPGARRNAAALAINGRVYVFGGEGHKEGAMPIVTYHPPSDTWTQKDAPTRIRHAWGAQLIGEKAYILGSSVDEGPGNRVLEEYDPVTDTITARTPLPRARSWYATTVVDGKIIVLGGASANDAPLSEVDIYDPATDTWTIGPDLPRPRRCFGAATVGNKLYLLGGVATDFAKPQSNVYTLDLSAIR